MKISVSKRAALAAVLAICFIFTACAAQWVQVALQDLPILTQMAINIIYLVKSAGMGTPPSQQDLDAIQRISLEAKTDLDLIQKLYDDYRANPSEGKKADIVKVGGLLVENLPKLLQSLRIQDDSLKVRVTAAVNLIVSTVNSFVALIPDPMAQARVKAAGPPPSPKQLRTQWNLICAGESACSIH